MYRQQLGVYELCACDETSAFQHEHDGDQRVQTI